MKGVLLFVANAVLPIVLCTANTDHSLNFKLGITANAFTLFIVALALTFYKQEFHLSVLFITESKMSVWRF